MKGNVRMHNAEDETNHADKSAAASKGRNDRKTLTMTRRPGEAVVLRVAGAEVRVRCGTHHHLTIEAPPSVEVLREELLD
jgi:hypothetical protein